MNDRARLPLGDHDNKDNAKKLEVDFRNSKLSWIFGKSGFCELAGKSESPPTATAHTP
jgi:hypothetical protein